MSAFGESIYRLIVETSTNLPADVRRALKEAQEAEDRATRAGLSLSTIACNIDMAEEKESPICQDTGMPTFFLHVPVGANQIVMKKEIREAVARATREGKLRTNSVDSLTGQNSGDNLGPGTPVIHFEQWERDDIEVRLILKGGGCENKNIQYSLPCELEGLGKAGRDLDGIRKCILHAVYQAQGHGCSAGFIGVGIGGDRTTGYELAKMQLLRPVDDVNPDPRLRELEEYIMKAANQLGIGTMGFGGNVTLLGCNCWAFRRQGVLLDGKTHEIKEWLYERGSSVKMEEPEAPAAAAGAAASAGQREFHLKAPLTEEDIRQLRVGDVVILSGVIHTGRDALHKYLMDHDAPVDLRGGVIYHCGPVVLKDGDGWRITAAGPTTSIREEPYQADIIRKFGVRAVIGKGGMGARTLAALKEHGAVYLNAVGGAAQYYARCIKKVLGVDLLEFGIPEAMWHLEVEGFAAIVTMDAHGNSLHADVERDSLEKLALFKDPVFV